jgi:hypothetical protein
MAEQIVDGNGTGYRVAVNTDNELRTRATTIEQRLHSALDSKYYELTTGSITLTNATDTPLIYFINNTTQDIIIDRIFVDTWTSTGATILNGTLKYYRNPAISGGSSITPNNTNFGSSETISIGGLKSLTTMTGTVWWLASISQNNSIIIDEGRIVIPIGSSFGISYSAPTGNTSQIININVAMFNFDSNLLGI